MNINTDCGHNRTTDTDMGPGSSPGLDSTMAPGGEEATHLSL